MNRSILARRAAVLCATVALACLTPGRSGAQVATEPSFRVGRTVRIFAPRVQEGMPSRAVWFVGALVDADSSTVTVQTVLERATLPREFVREFSVQTDTRYRLRAAVLNVVAGTAAGLFVGHISTPLRTDSPGERGRHLRNGALIGAASGVLYAAVVPWHRWQSVDVPTEVVW